MLPLRWSVVGLRRQLVPVNSASLGSFRSSPDRLGGERHRYAFVKPNISILARRPMTVLMGTVTGSEKNGKNVRLVSKHHEWVNARPPNSQMRTRTETFTSRLADRMQDWRPYAVESEPTGSYCLRLYNVEPVAIFLSSPRNICIERNIFGLTPLPQCRTS